MLKIFKKYFACFCAVLSILFLFSGCWDSHELESLFIVTAIGIDPGEEPKTIHLAVEVEQSTPKKDSSSDSSKKTSSLVLESTAPTIGEALYSVERSSSRSLLLPHNQVVLFGSDLAKQGVKPWLDPVMRNQTGRMEILLMVSENPAKEVLSEKLDQEDMAGMYIARLMQELNAVSPYYNIRLLDFVSALSTQVTSPVAPLVQLQDTNDGKALAIKGLAVFKDDKMVGKLSMNQFISYVWTMGKVERCGVIVKEGNMQANLGIDKLTSKKEINLLEDNQVEVKINIEAALSITELNGFGGVTKKKLMPMLKQMAEDQIKKQILDTFHTAQELKADIYGIGATISRDHFQQWKKIKGEWDDIFVKIKPEISVKADIIASGQIMNSLEMQEVENEN